MATAPAFSRGAFYLLFTASGFSGLIYESIWSHYLKLFLGHAAYAQSLVLATFMGGMALGSWASSRWSRRWPNLLLAYALAEGAVGLLGVVFHPVFLATTGFAYDTVIPALGSPGAATLAKWTLSALLILPQSILLGMTFPLVAGGMIRLHPQGSGSTLSMLYFTNSLGASVGVLASGFVLIERVGLPGTILTAGLINIALALLVWTLVKLGRAPDAAPAAERPAEPGAGRPYALFLAIALLTGAASFIYEIGWIRMLSMVFGASTHAFELMLSAFILGLALGGLWMRRRIDGIALPERFLGWVQVVMGLAAIATLPVYDGTYAVMEWLLSAISRSEAGYAVYNVSTHLVAFAVMLPAAFCAGTTLPLITHCLLRSGAGERAIGAVYAANTVGAIAGVVAALHIGLPVLGLKGLMVAGASLDILLGIVLLWRVAAPRAPALAATVLGALAVAATLALVELDPYKMASGVYRYGRTLDPRTSKVEYHRDGKTASVSLVRIGHALSLHTNGKPDASLNVTGVGPPRPDELAQVLSGALPIAANPRARTAANIGFGSGATSHVLLSSRALDAVDSIEIEPFVVEAARRFRPRNDLAFTDPRSRIFYEDAKTFFSLHDKRYDIIVSEPSNPWVSGTASLFTEEFYARMRRHLNPGGVLVQWLQMYEISEALVASVLKALERHFPGYEVFAATDTDFIVLAWRDGPPRLDPSRLFGEPALARELARIGIRTPGDLALHRAGSAAAFQPYVQSLRVAANSDYFPILEFRAPKARFLNHTVGFALDLAVAPVPMLEMLSARATRDAPPTPGERAWLLKARRREEAREILAYLLGPGDAAPASHADEARLVRLLLIDCARPERAAEASEPLFRIAGAIAPALAPDELRPLWERIRRTPCHARTAKADLEWLALYAAVSERDAARMAQLAQAMLEGGAAGASRRQRGYLLGAAVTGLLARGDRARAAELLRQHGGREAELSALQRAFLAAHAGAK
jgi:predicted membrane-bound spermidine synthase